MRNCLNCLENRKLSRLYERLSITAVMSSTHRNTGYLSRTRRRLDGNKKQRSNASLMSMPIHTQPITLPIAITCNLRLVHQTCFMWRYRDHCQSCMHWIDIFSVVSRKLASWPGLLSPCPRSLSDDHHLAATSRQQQVGQPGSAGSAGHICSLLSLQSTHLAADSHIFTKTITIYRIYHCGALLHSLYSLTHPNQCSRWRWKY